MNLDPEDPYFKIAFPIHMLNLVYVLKHPVYFAFIEGNKNISKHVSINYSHYNSNS